MNASLETTLVYYDIASGPPVRPFSPNPWKARYALNYKRAPYKTNWVELPDVTSTRKALGVPPVRKWTDGSDYYTLPVLVNPSSGEKIGDSFDIALYTDTKYPSSSTPDSHGQGQELFPPNTIILHRVFNTYVDNLFTPYGFLFAHGMPLNPATADRAKDDMKKRMALGGAMGGSWEDWTVKGQERRDMLKRLQKDLETLEGFFREARKLEDGESEKETKEEETGPFMEGRRVLYADFIVGGWLKFLHVTLPEEEWEELCTWQNGRWGRFCGALEAWEDEK